MLKLFKRKARPVYSDALLNQLYRYGFSLCHSSEQAYELLQSCCEKVLQKDPPPEPLQPYMMRVIRNEFIDNFRRKKLELVVDEDQYIDASIVEKSLQNMELLLIDQQHVGLVMERLSEDERELLYLWAVEGLSVQEIAITSGVARGTLLSRVSRLKKRLSDEFGHLIEEVS
ncbi:RNA polymerase sigma factor [Agarivorans litoreus]|uniref:RNA polymerase sigma factor n=1 Tax=Agarivorans litoreus TaxID=1510455 RepID=UPI001C7DAE9E|nr:RNA polymerase sigma factor [Agarivorans litoreus]